MVKEMDLVKRSLDKISFVDKGNIVNLLESGIFYVLSKNRDIENEVEGIFMKVRKLLPKGLHTSILYLIGELVDNINQHSNYSKGFIFLNTNAESGETQIIIYDDGIGIPSGFRNSGIEFSDDSEAIELAINGKSTKKEEGRGFGLPSSLRLIEKGLKGKVAIFSGKGNYESGLKKKEMEEGLQGTFIFVQFEDKGEGLNIYKYLE